MNRQLLKRKFLLWKNLPPKKSKTLLQTRHLLWTNLPNRTQLSQVHRPKRERRTRSARTRSNHQPRHQLRSKSPFLLMSQSTLRPHLFLLHLNATSQQPKRSPFHLKPWRLIPSFPRPKQEPAHSPTHQTKGPSTLQRRLRRLSTPRLAAKRPRKRRRSPRRQSHCWRSQSRTMRPSSLLRHMNQHQQSSQSPRRPRSRMEANHHRKLHWRRH